MYLVLCAGGIAGILARTQHLRPADILLKAVLSLSHIRRRCPGNTQMWRRPTSASLRCTQAYTTEQAARTHVFFAAKQNARFFIRNSEQASIVARVAQRAVFRLYYVLPGGCYVGRTAQLYAALVAESAIRWCCYASPPKSTRRRSCRKFRVLGTRGGDYKYQCMRCLEVVTPRCLDTAAELSRDVYAQ